MRPPAGFAVAAAFADQISCFLQGRAAALVIKRHHGSARASDLTVRAARGTAFVIAMAGDRSYDIGVSAIMSRPAVPDKLVERSPRCRGGG
jgi:hypothetical protein